MNNLWKFSLIPCIEESTFNKVLERFYNFGISGLVRENIQNSLDGKIPNLDKPVIVKIKTGTINKKYIPGLDEIKKRINSLEGRNSYTKETIEHMKNKMHIEEVSYISFEDENTKGLKGANNGQSTNKEDTYSIYAYNKGVHSEEKDESLEKSRGGSHGIGKIASNAASELYMMYFANCDEEGNKHLGGTVQLIEHKYEENYYRSTGYFTDIKNIDSNTTKFYPYENKFNEVFAKNTRGLKIIIPFLRDQFNNEDEILKSVCDSFFIAILQNKLEVVINEKIINCKTLKKYITNKKYYIQNVEEVKDEFTPLYFNTYINMKPIKLQIKDKSQHYNFNLYFNYDTKIPKGRTAIVRTIGMKIEDKKIKNNVKKPFNAVLIPDSIVEDAFLKSLENESHTELSYDHIKDQSLQKNAKTFINNISKEIAKVIEDAIKSNNPTDGIMDTADVLYEIQTQFKKELLKSISTVKLSKGKGKEEHTVLKVNSEISKKKDSKDKSKNSDGNKKKRSAKKVKLKGGRIESKITYSAPSDIVERVIIGNKEYVKFDFRDTDDLKKSKKCDVSLNIVDGMGQECPNEFSMKSSYEYALDKSTGNKLNIEDNLIKDIKIKNGVAQIELKLKSEYNKALKFVYYVGV